MNVNPKSIVVSFSERDRAFHRETLIEHTQGNTLRLLKGHAVAYHPIAVVATPEEADKAVENFTHLQRVAQGLAEPILHAAQAGGEMAQAIS